MTTHHDEYHDNGNSGPVAAAPTPPVAEAVAAEHDAALRYIRDWCPDTVRDYVAHLQQEIQRLMEERDKARRERIGDWATQRDNDRLTIQLYEWKGRAEKAEAALSCRGEDDPYWNSEPGVAWNAAYEADFSRRSEDNRRPTGHVEIAHDGFAGDIIGHYTTREGKRGVVVQQDGTRVVHVYGEKWLHTSHRVEDEWRPNKDYHDHRTWPPYKHPLYGMFHDARLWQGWQRERYETLIDWLFPASPDAGRAEG